MFFKSQASCHFHLRFHWSGVNEMVQTGITTGSREIEETQCLDAKEEQM